MLATRGGATLGNLLTGGTVGRNGVRAAVLGVGCLWQYATPPAPPTGPGPGR